MARVNSQQTFDLEDLLEVISQLINSQPVPTVNPPTPSLNDFTQSDGSISFTNEEINQLKEVIASLETEQNQLLDAERQALTDTRLDKQQLQERIEQEVRNDLRAQIKEEVIAEVKAEVTEELRGKLVNDKCSGLSIKDDQKTTFKQELVNYSLEYTPVKVTIHSGKELKGVLCEVEADFIIIVNKKNQFIKLPLAKIIAVKKIANLNSQPEEPEETKVEERVEEEKPEEVPLPAPEKLLQRNLVTVGAGEQKKNS